MGLAVQPLAFDPGALGPGIGRLPPRGPSP